MRSLESVSSLAFLVITVSGRVQINAGTGLEMREVCQEVHRRRESWTHDVKPSGSGI